MNKITKEQVLSNLEEVKKFITEAEQEKKEEKFVGIAIKNRLTGSIIFQSTKTTFKEAVIERLSSNADLSNADLIGADLIGVDFIGADLIGTNLSYANLSYANLSYANLSNANLSNAYLSNANLSGANLSGAELNCAKFYGRGGTKELTKAQLPAFLGALGFVIVD